MSAALRIIDANANRAREALRVLEEAARFVLDDALLTEQAKLLRHDLTTSMLRFTDLAFWRDVREDVGTGIAAPSEMKRDTLADVVAASGSRLGEALRALEEYGKTIDPAFAAGIEQLRYRGYELARRLHTRLARPGAAQWRICVIITESMCAPRPWLDVAMAAVEGGANCIQLREKEIEDGEFLRRARSLVKAVAGRASVIINDRPHIALLSGATGVHLGQNDLPVQEARRIVGSGLVIGVSTSRMDEARRAHAEGADYCGVGPMFATTTKKKDRIAGPAYLAEYVAWGQLPHLAIGGITPENVGALVKVGCRGVAVCSSVCSAKDPAAAVGFMRRAVETHAVHSNSDSR